MKEDKYYRGKEDKLANYIEYRKKIVIGGTTKMTDKQRIKARKKRK